MQLNSLPLFSVFIFTLLTNVCEGGEEYAITRSLYNYDQDVFKVPASKCTTKGSECVAYNNAYHYEKSCKCSCPANATTFGFYSGSWTCIDNKRFRNQKECKYKLDAEWNDSPLTVLEDTFSYTFFLPIRFCSVNLTASQYFDCDGTWKNVETEMSSRFSSIISNNVRPWPYADFWEYTLEVRATKLTTGTAVSLLINCGNISQSSCLLFKIAGQQTCSSTPNIISIQTTRSSLTKSPGHHDQLGSASSSPGTIAAVITIVVFLIILSVITASVIWKKKRGENALLMDKMLGIVKKVRTSSTKTLEDADEQVYAEIPEQTARRQTPTRTDMLVGSAGINNYALKETPPIYAFPNQFVRDSGSMGREEAQIDDEGYLVPREMALYVEFKGTVDAVEKDNDEKEKKTRNGEEREQTEQESSSEGGGEGSNMTSAVYACVNKQGKLSKPPERHQVSSPGSDGIQLREEFQPGKTSDPFKNPV